MRRVHYYKVDDLKNEIVVDLESRITLPTLGMTEGAHPDRYETVRRE
jgi:hypothetical protein